MGVAGSGGMALSPPPARPALVVSLALLAACDGVPIPGSCDALPEPPPVAACFGGDDVAWEGYGTVATALSGTVMSASHGPFPADCDVRFGGLVDGDALLLVVEDAAGGRVVAGLVAPGLGDPVAVGDTVGLDLSYTFGEFGPDLAWAVLSDEAGERVVVATAGSLEEVRTPEGVTLAEGDTRCTEDDGCGEWSAYDLDVAVDGDAASVPYGEEADVGGWHVVHGGLERQAEGQMGTCPDWFVAHASVATIRR